MPIKFSILYQNDYVKTLKFMKRRRQVRYNSVLTFIFISLHFSMNISDQVVGIDSDARKALNFIEAGRNTKFVQC